jgi:hypothetical protein
MAIILEAALAYAAHGWEVFPVPPGTKKSYLSSKFNGNDKWGKTTDPALIRQYWMRWPNANVAIVTGMKSGIWVMEADTAAGHGVDGIASLRKLEAEHGRLPNTRSREPERLLALLFCVAARVHHPQLRVWDSTGDRRPRRGRHGDRAAERDAGQGLVPVGGLCRHSLTPHPGWSQQQPRPTKAITGRQVPSPRLIQI